MYGNHMLAKIATLFMQYFFGTVVTAHTSHVSAALHRDSVHAPQAQITMTS